MTSHTPLKCLIIIALSSIACAGVPRAERDQMKTITQQLDKNPAGDCVKGLKQVAPYEKHAKPDMLGRKDKDAQSALRAAYSRCNTQARKDIRSKNYAAAIYKLEAWKRILPSTFPTKKTSGSWMSTGLTGLGMLEKYKPTATKQLEAFNKVYTPYKAIDAKKHPTVAYHHLVEVLKVRPPTMAIAETLDHDRTALIKQLLTFKSLSHNVNFAEKSKRASTVETIHRQQIKRQRDFIYTTTSPYIELTVKMGKPIVKTGKTQVTFNKKYVQGTRMVKNTAYHSAKSRLAELQRRYQSTQKSYSRIKCSGNGVKGRDCGRAEAQRLQSLSKDIKRARGDLRGGPMKKQTIYGNFSYPATKPYKSISLPMTIEVRWPANPKRKPAVLTFTPNATGNALIHKAYPKYGIRAQNRPITSDSAIIQTLYRYAAQNIIGVLKKVNVDRAQQPKPKGLTSTQEAEYWLSTFCVRAPNTPAKQKLAKLNALPNDAKQIIGKNICDYNDYSSSLNNPNQTRRKYVALAHLDKKRSRK